MRVCASVRFPTTANIFLFRLCLRGKRCWGKGDKGSEVERRDTSARHRVSSIEEKHLVTTQRRPRLSARRFYVFVFWRTPRRTIALGHGRLQVEARVLTQTVIPHRPLILNVDWNFAKLAYTSVYIGDNRILATVTLCVTFNCVCEWACAGVCLFV